MRPDVPARALVRLDMERRPLTGFGWAGVAASVVLIAAILVAWFEINVWGLVFQAVYDLWGYQAVSTILNRWNIPHYLAVQMPIAGPICLVYLLPALHIAPGRRPWWLWTCVVAALVMTPLAWYAMVTGRYAGTFPPYLGGDYMGFAAVFDVAFVATLGLVTRSIATVAIGVAASLACCWLAGHPGVTPLELVIANWGWHIAIAASLSFWAVRRRLRRSPPWECQQCGYDCRGVSAPLCPECGAARVSL